MDSLNSCNCFSMFQIHQELLRILLALHCQCWTNYSSPPIKPYLLHLLFTDTNQNHSHSPAFIEAFGLFLILKSSHRLRGTYWSIPNLCSLGFIISLSLRIFCQFYFRHLQPWPHPTLVFKCSYFTTEITNVTLLKLHLPILPACGGR